MGDDASRLQFVIVETTPSRMDQARTPPTI